jgi:hypothetical protein
MMQSKFIFASYYQAEAGKDYIIGNLWKKLQFFAIKEMVG